MRTLNYATSWYLKMSNEFGLSTDFIAIGSGTSFKSLCDNFSIYSSGVSPIYFPVALGWPSKSVSINSLTYFYLKVILAFGCNPNTVGSSSEGSSWMCYLTYSKSNSFGDL